MLVEVAEDEDEEEANGGCRVYVPTDGTTEEADQRADNGSPESEPPANEDAIVVHGMCA
ncbi:hypothetical protein FKW77_004948 [Venturia effusa]|uniref:Uncharacterized protein n=1 Tax=Venturia effusa TaxID=50376 RepID=A0A517LDN6_9PEZI|nr:hypothetical protein FKW77_004948 [Venturia effusa]